MRHNRYMPPRIRDPLVAQKVGAVIRTLRLSRGQRQVDIAQAAEVGRDTIVGIELGKGGPSLDVLFRIAEALGTKPSVLLAVAEAQLAAMAAKGER